MSETSEHIKGQMDVQGQSATYSGFLTATAWSSIILILMLGYAIFTITMGVHWLVALPVFAIVGVLAGQALGLGTGFLVAVGGLVVLGVFVQILVSLGGALM